MRKRGSKSRSPDAGRKRRSIVGRRADAPRLGDKDLMIEDSVRSGAAERWQEENARAVEAYNQRAFVHGVFSDGLREF